ncbi:hypothetical protein FKP32DRAFT_1579041 [Trametes sanguinea]|nr:hypothetical protein FKP32DRAFT_1579041 [Trametes sanguinea]
MLFIVRADFLISSRRLVENYCIIASSALLWFDFALTFTDEYRRIWKRKWTGATLVYLLTRYVAVIERIFFVLEVLVWNSSDQVRPSLSCGGITHTDDVLLFLNYLAFSVFTCLRIYGVWGRDWKPLLLVLPLTLVKPIAGIIEVAHYTPVQAGPPYGCVYIYHVSHTHLSHPVSITSKATTIAADAILIGLTWIKTFGIKRDALHTGMRTPLATLLLRDGTAYFLVLLLIQVITIISNRKLTIWLVWPYFDQVLTVIFLSRFMLDLRGLYFAERGGPEDQTSLHLSDVKFQGFASGMVGNFGATLNTTLAVDVPGLDSPSTEGSDTASYSEMRFHWEWDDDEQEYCNDPFVAGMKAQVMKEEGLALDTLDKQHTDSDPRLERVEEGGVETPSETRWNSTQVRVHDFLSFLVLIDSEQDETREDISPV